MGAGDEMTEENCEARCDQDNSCKGIEFMKTQNQCFHWFGEITGDGTASEDHSCKLKPQDKCDEYQIIVYDEGSNSYKCQDCPRL